MLNTMSTSNILSKRLARSIVLSSNSRAWSFIYGLKRKAEEILKWAIDLLIAA